MLNMVEKELKESLELLQAYRNDSLRDRIASIESKLQNNQKSFLMEYLDKENIDDSLIKAAFKIKDMSSQIDVLVHSIGILLVLTKILDDDEEIEYLSLGAGNTGKPFDLETNERIAEFKFIDWKDGPESIRQNSVFKDFYNLAESKSNKRRELYIFNRDVVIKFLNGKRALKSVLSKNNKLKDEFFTKYPDMNFVKEYYNCKKDVINIIDVSKYLSRI